MDVSSKTHSNVFSKRRRMKKRSANQEILILCMYVLLSAKADQSPDVQCTIEKVSHGLEAPTVVILTWEVNKQCQDKFTQFKVYPEHLKWNACLDESNDAYHAKIKETTEKTARIAGLYPFSRYRFEIVALLKTGGVATSVIEVETNPDVPQVLPQFSDSSPLSLSQAIKFYWEPPANADCKFFNGQLGQYRIEFWGVDPWVVQEEPLWNKTVSLHEYYAEGLRFFTAYELRIFAQTIEGQYNSNLGLSLKAKTESADRPDPPVNISMTAVESSVHLRWNPPYPPTGRVIKYKLRYGVNNTIGPAPIHWIKPIEVPIEHTCMYKRVVEGNEPLCWTISGLEPDTLYFVEVQTFAHDADLPSLYSNTVVAQTAVGPKLVTEKPDASVSTSVSNESTNKAARTPRANVGVDEQGPSKLIIVGFVLLGCLAVVGFCTGVIYKIKEIKLKKRFENQGSVVNDSSLVRSHRLSATSMTYDPGMSIVTDMTTLSSRGQRGQNYVQQWADQIQDIQSRRLPEPPPDQIILPGTNSRRRPQGEPSEYLEVRPASRRPPSPILSSLQDDPELGVYLRPTFRPSGSPPRIFHESLLTSTPNERKIPAVSYDPPTVLGQGVEPNLTLSRPDLIRGMGQLESQSEETSNDIFPMMTSKSVQV
ncbi:hypothetical protein TCAL_14207 [Tigriopus californicus]|uniref:Fibronectin type-III domain-containing protein n=1 Tax=Tigriopus californicus TaxID=6832 RepID=A0A553NSR3_TIGCA|nr:hypothetical protein TCAL_14207 [Tigriopus californicus]